MKTRNATKTQLKNLYLKLGVSLIALTVVLFSVVGVISYSAYHFNDKITDEIAMSSTIVSAEYIPPVEEEPEEVEEKPEEIVEQVEYIPEDTVDYYDDTEYYEESTYDDSYSGNGSGLTKQSGVNQYNGRRETYYSSNVLRHYRIDEWHTDENGVWRDSDGYVVVAADDIPEGGLVDTSFGEGKVYDCGVGYDGGTDIYTNW